MGVTASSPIIDVNVDANGNSNNRSTTERINASLIQKLLFALIRPKSMTISIHGNDESDSDNDDGNDDDENSDMGDDLDPIVAEYMLEMLDVEFISRYRDV